MTKTDKTDEVVATLFEQNRKQHLVAASSRSKVRSARMPSDLRDRPSKDLLSDMEITLPSGLKLTAPKSWFNKNGAIRENRKKHYHQMIAAAMIASQEVAVTVTDEEDIVIIGDNRFIKYRRKAQ